MNNLKKHTYNDVWIFFGLLIPLIIFVNLLLFGSRYLFDIRISLPASVLTGAVLGISWQIHRWVAFTLRNRFSGEAGLYKRAAFGIFIFVLMTAITTTVLFYGYDYFKIFQYELDEVMYNWALGIGVIADIFIIVVHEIAYNFEKWRATLSETEQLKKEYMQSQIIGLRNQVSPHFLFNSLNSLSSLIHEEPVRAEQFLNEMSKVYRYLLRNNEEQTVDLETELQFVHSYFHLLKARYGNGIELYIEVDDEDRKMHLPPLTMQILLDNILKINSISKDRPLKIKIQVNETGWMEIQNNVQKRTSETSIPDNMGITNISNKLRLLCHHSIEIHQTDQYRIMSVPLLSPETVSTA